MKRRTRHACIIFIAALGAMVLHGCAGSETGDKPGKAAQTVEGSAGKARRTGDVAAPSAGRLPSKKKRTPAARLDDRERYEAFAGAKMRDFANRIEEMKEGSSRVSGRNKGRIDREVRRLEQLYGEAKASYQGLLKASANEWKAARAATDESIARFESVY